MSSFDRIRPRDPDDPPTPAATVAGEADGRRALFSTEQSVPALGSVVIECSSCGASSVLGVRAALKAALPSLHLPLLKKGHSSWMRCPSCGQHTWVKVSIRL